MHFDRDEIGFRMRFGDLDVVSPMPEPISSTSGRAAEIFCSEKARPYFGNSSSSARSCAGVVLPWRRT